MHELQITERILEIVLKHAQAAHAKNVISIRLTIGELSDLENEWVEKYFAHLSKGTIAEKALLQIDRTPIALQCDACRCTLRVDKNAIPDATCPNCACERFSLVSGREYRIEDIRVI
ncbi:MAG: hydrogenase maturation nickel metallochaperone HypA [Myxococcota bacterium]|nr:hydrogenase maturation nickel metallochaperone HypA [Myxococcota bacterium]